jgi:hypothetical protein
VIRGGAGLPGTGTAGRGRGARVAPRRSGGTREPPAARFSSRLPSCSSPGRPAWLAGLPGHFALVGLIRSFAPLLPPFYPPFTPFLLPPEKNST